MQEAWWWDEFKAHIRETRPTITDSTINRIITTGTTCFAFTRGRGLHAYDLPKANIREKEGKHRVTWFTREQVDEMYRVGHKLATDENGYGVVANAILFAAYTGVRREELCKLRTKDINLEDGKVWIGGKPEVVTRLVITEQSRLRIASCLSALSWLLTIFLTSASLVSTSTITRLLVKHFFTAFK